jgi:hypothetical protein
MNRATFFPRAPLDGLLLRTATVIFLSAAATAYASTGGLAISGMPSTVATMGRAYAFTPAVANPAKRSLQFHIWNKPAWATFNATTGHLAGTPAAAAAGTQSYITIFVTDGATTSYLPAFTLSVLVPAADKPVLSGNPPTSATAGQTYSFTPTVSNPAKLQLSFNIWNKPAWATFNYRTGQLGGTPPAASAGTASFITIIATDGVVKSYLPAFSLKVVSGTGTAAGKPVISGTPSTSVTAGSTYRFQPAAKDPAGRALSFSVKNKPSWASFSISSGLLDGTPTSSQDGTYGNIIISASNGQSSSALPAFSVTVSSATATGHAATVNWVPPTKNTNGSALTDLAGIRIYYGTSASSLGHMLQVASASSMRTTISNLTAGTWYFAGAAYTTTGVESAKSGVVSKYIP